jgi:ABC-type sugar transport system permease subunit
LDSKHAVFKAMKQHAFCYAWIAPFFILFAVFQLYPMLYGFWISLASWSGFEPPRYIGWENYGQLFHDSLFWETLKNTFLLWLYIVPSRTFLALVLAALVSSPKVKGRKVYSFFLLLPYITAIVVVAIVFRILFATHGGLVNVLLNLAGIAPVEWLDSAFWSKITIGLMNIWRLTGYFMIVMLAGLQRIPKSIYEAAEIDGCTSVKAFFRITVPQMYPIIFFVALTSTIWIFQNIGDAMVLTQGGPGYSSTPLVYYMYRNAFEFYKLGYASAITYVIFAILLLLSSVVVKSQKDRFEE